MTKETVRLSPKDFEHAPAPDSWHEWLQKEEARDRRHDDPELIHPFGRPMKQLLDGTWVPDGQ